jgi:hypothetical protein
MDSNKYDVTSLAVKSAEDGVRVADTGPGNCRQAIEKYYLDRQTWHFINYLGAADNEMIKISK